MTLVVWTHQGGRILDEQDPGPFAMFGELRMDALQEAQADRALAEGRRFASRGGHEWLQEAPGDNVPVPCTATLGLDGNPVAW